MPSKYQGALADLEADLSNAEAEVARLRAAIEAVRALDPPAAPAAPARRRPGRPRKTAAVAAPKRGAAKAAAPPKRRGAKAAAKPAGRRGRKPRGAKKPAGPKLEPRIEQYFASNPKRKSTAQEIGDALGADQRAVRLSLGRMAKKNKATRLDDGSYRAYAG